MTEFTAFVGHSFTEDDKLLIRQFTDFFDQTHRIRPDFSWCHAEVAEPTALAKKVLGLIEGCNIFIAICSRKERVLRKEISGIYARISGRSHEFEWKTSDWIIQEIGLAIGRGIPVIILLEDGVRRPGGLQGDVEYISFSRENPNACFGKFMEMISSLTPSDAGTTGSTSPATKVEEAPEGQLNEGYDWTVPKPDWSASKHRRLIEFAVLTENNELRQKISESYKSLFNSDVDKARWEAAEEYALMHDSAVGRLDTIRSIAKSNKSDPIVQTYFARALAYFSEHQNSAEIFEEAAKLSSESDGQFEILGDALIQYQKAGSQYNCERVVSDIESRMRENKTPTAIRSLFNYASLAKNEILFISTAEQLLEINPGDFDVRFSLAFRYSETGFDDLAFWHYKKIPYSDRNSTVWNNLGVSFKTFNMNSKSIGAFRKSADYSDHSASLAMANLAGRFHDAGFEREAKELCDEALKIENYHNNVLSIMETIRKNADEEDEKEKKKIEEFGLKNSFIRDFSRAKFELLKINNMSLWSGQSMDFKLEYDDNEIVLSGHYYTQDSSITAALSGVAATKNNISYKLAVHGRAAVGAVSRGNSKSSSLSLLSDTATREVFAWISSDGKTIEFLEEPRGAGRRYAVVSK